MGELAKGPNCAAAGQGRPRNRVRSAALLDGARELIIEHEGVEYVLRLTSQNKLILTK